MTTLLDDMLCEFEIGDLVRLIEDSELKIGCGLITDIKNDLNDVYDIEYFRARIKSLKEELNTEDENIFPSRPQILVLWTGKNFTSNNTSIWMYATDLTIVKKVIK